MREYYIPTNKDWVVSRLPMICGQAEAQSRTYFKHIGKSGKIWLISTDPNCADHIYVEGEPGSDGFGGSTLEFKVTYPENETIQLKGPWHSNSGAFFNDVGIDISDKHYVMVVIGEDVRYGRNYENIVYRVLHQDKEPVLGTFHRGDVLGREWAQKRGQRVYVIDQSMGGGRYRFVEPNAEFYWEKKHPVIDVSSNQLNVVMS